MNTDADLLMLSDYLTVGAASLTLGVSRSTLRNWDKTGQLKAYRHPINGYRLYRKLELENLLQDIQLKHHRQGPRP